MIFNNNNTIPFLFGRFDDFEIVYFPFPDEGVHRSLPVVYTFCILFVSREYVLMLVISTTEKKEGNDQDSIQLSTTPGPGHHIET